MTGLGPAEGITALAEAQALRGCGVGLMVEVSGVWGVTGLSAFRTAGCGLPSTDTVHVCLCPAGYGGYDDYNGYNDGYGFGSDRFGRGKVSLELPARGYLPPRPSRPQLLFFRNVRSQIW